MKLIFCRNCQSLVKLNMSLKYCECKKSYGRYIDDLNAEYSGPAIPIGIANQSFLDAYYKHNALRTHKEGIEFKAFFISDNCSSFKRK